jgi:hypothetical protein
MYEVQHVFHNIRKKNSLTFIVLREELVTEKNNKIEKERYGTKSVSFNARKKFSPKPK